MNKKRILALADLIEKQPHADEEDTSGFNMGDYTHNCGTPSCIAGWAASLSTLDGSLVLVDIEEEARKYLGVSSLTSRSLFKPEFPGKGTYETILCWNKITPQQAATTLRKLAETGEVDWSHVS